MNFFKACKVATVVLIFFGLTAWPQPQAASLPNITKLMGKQQEFIPAEVLSVANFKDNFSSTMPTGETFIDNSIDEDHYFIGMGDAFQIDILEMPSITATVSVNQNGDLNIPKIGILPLGKISLREAKAAIAEFVRKEVNQRYTVYVTFLKGKKVRVSVNGSVSRPGTYFIDGIMRISDCITRANEGELPLVGETDLRSIAVTSNDTTLYYDMLRYYLKNDISQNPYIYPGDIVYVPPIRNRVYVQGEIADPAPGFIPIRPNERLNDLFDILMLTAAADSSRIIIQKGPTVEERYDTIASLKEANGVILNNSDIISVSAKAKYPQISTVYISGAVERPGPYNCIEHISRAEDIFKLCGGFLSKANPARAYIIRKNAKLVSNNNNVPPELANVPDVPGFNAGSIRPELNFAFSRLNNFKDYSIISLADQGYGTVLENEDQIVVPFSDPFVYISGSVEKPGAYPYVEGKSTREYIREAGWFSGKADRRSTYVLTRYKSSLQIKDGATVEEGDIIVVPDSKRNAVMSEVVLPVLQIVSTLTTIVFAIFTMSRTSSN